MFYLTRRAKRKGLQLYYMTCVVICNLVFDPIFWSATSKKRGFLFFFPPHVHELHRGKARGLYQLLTAICCTDNDDSSRARAFGSVYASHLKKYTYIYLALARQPQPAVADLLTPQTRAFGSRSCFLLSSSYVQQL